MVKWLQLLVSGGVAVVAFFYMQPNHWETIRTETLLALSVLAGAVLFRLGRGVPALPLDHLDVSEVKTLATALQIVSRRLVWIIAITSMAILGLIAVGFGQEICQNPTLWRLATSVLAFVIALVMCRAIMLVQGDHELVVLHSELLVKSAQLHKAGVEEKKLNVAEKDQPHKTPQNYGRLIKPH